jgi:hypothetical protein
MSCSKESVCLYTDYKKNGQNISRPNLYFFTKYYTLYTIELIFIPAPTEHKRI